MSSTTAPHPAGPDWQAVAQDYGNRILSVKEICLLHGVSRTRLYQRVHDEQWPRRHQPSKYSAKRIMSSAEHMPNRLLRALDLKMTELENCMTANADAPSAADCERNVRTLNTLVGLFEKLKKQDMLDKKALHSANSGSAAAPDADTLRRELLERLQRLNRGKAGEAEAVQDDR